MRAMLVHQINAACITQSFFTKNGYKEKWALLMNQLATSEYLPNEVKGALEIVVKDRKWNREARYYWHALDSFTIHTMKNLRSTKQKAEDEMDEEDDDSEPEEPEGTTGSSDSEAASSTCTAE